MLFKSKTERRAEKLIDEIIRMSKITAEQKCIFPMGTDNQYIECILVALTGFLVCGFDNDFDLAFELIPTYQKRIMLFVSRETYDHRNKIIQKCYSEYREEAILIQESRENHFVPLVEKFAEMTAKYCDVEFTKECRDILCSLVLELIDTVNPDLGVWKDIKDFGFDKKSFRDSNNDYANPLIKVIRNILFLIRHLLSWYSLLVTSSFVWGILLYYFRFILFLYKELLKLHKVLFWIIGVSAAGVLVTGLYHLLLFGSTMTVLISHKIWTSANGTRYKVLSIIYTIICSLTIFFVIIGIAHDELANICTTVVYIVFSIMIFFVGRRAVRGNSST